MSRFSAGAGGDKQIMYWEYEGYSRPFLQCMGMYLIYIHIYVHLCIRTPPSMIHRALENTMHTENKCFRMTAFYTSQFCIGGRGFASLVCFQYLCTSLIFREDEVRDHSETRTNQTTHGFSYVGYVSLVLQLEKDLELLKNRKPASIPNKKHHTRTQNKRKKQQQTKRRHWEVWRLAEKLLFAQQMGAFVKTT